VTSANSHHYFLTDLNTRDLFITHLPPKPISNDDRKGKSYGNLMNDNKNEERNENE